MKVAQKKLWRFMQNRHSYTYYFVFSHLRNTKLAREATKGLPMANRLMGNRKSKTYPKRLFGYRRILDLRPKISI